MVRPGSPAHAKESGPLPKSRPPAGGLKLSCRRMSFNGASGIVSVWRFPDPPEDVLARLSGDLAARGVEGRRTGPGRLSWREPGAGTVEACLIPEGSGTRGIWSERTGEAFRPDGGECPGRDLEGVGKPAGWKRLFCIDAGPSRMLCYAAPEAPAAALAAYERGLADLGWTRRGAGAQARWVRGGGRCLLGAEEADGGSQVSVVVVEREEER